MAEPMILELLNNLRTRVATNETNIATNASTIATNKQLFDTHTADDNRHWTTTDRQNFNRVVHFKGYYTTAANLRTAYPTAQTGDYAIVGATDTVWAWDDSTGDWLNTTEQGVVITVNGRTGEVILTKTDVGLSNVDNTSDVNKPISTAQQTALNAKADRGLITSAQADDPTLKSGIYYLNSEYTILNDENVRYWTIVHSAGVDKTSGTGEIGECAYGSQIWINYTTNGSGKIYYRRQQHNYTTNKPDWSEFKEILTSDTLSVINQRMLSIEGHIANNTTDISDLQSDKVDRKVITAAQADSLNLRAGIYYLDSNRTINGFSATNWNIIVGELVSNNSTKGATQTWINCQSNTIIHMFVRRQQDNSGTQVWSDFTEVLTSTQLATINQALSDETTARQNADTNLDDKKADRKGVTSAMIESVSGLNSGLYRLGTSKEIMGYTYDSWNIIAIEAYTGVGGSQIWMPFSTSAPNLMFIRHQNGSSWGSFNRILTDTDFTNLQTQITTNATNIATNATNITSLTNNKAARGSKTATEIDGLTLRAGIYSLNDTRTILGYSDNYWTVIVGEHPTNNTSRTQIWMPSYADNGVIPHMYIRRANGSNGTSWSDFVEIYTTNNITAADLTRFKQYKGYFATLTALQTAYATATDGDYAIVGTSIYIWDSTYSRWQQSSGSGGSGVNKWSIRRFEGIETRVTPDFTYLTNKLLEKQWEVNDTDGYILNESTTNNKFYMIETFINMQSNTDVTVSSLEHDDGVRVYLNGISIYSKQDSLVGQSLTLQFKQGWNRIQAVLQDLTGAEKFKLGVKLSSNSNCLSMDCYHSETELTQGYVPLRGDSTVIGNVTVTGNITGQNDLSITNDIIAGGDIEATGDLTAGGVVNITENSYIQYNSSDKSLSFMFN